MENPAEANGGGGSGDREGAGSKGDADGKGRCEKPAKKAVAKQFNRRDPLKGHRLHGIWLPVNTR